MTPEKDNSVFFEYGSSNQGLLLPNQNNKQQVNEYFSRQMIDIQKRRLEQQLSDHSKERGQSVDDHGSVSNEKKLIYPDIMENPNVVTAQSISRAAKQASNATPNQLLLNT